VLTEMPVAVVDRNVDKHGTRAVAEAFAAFLFSPEAQKAFVDNGFRPATEAGKAYAKGKFPAFKSFTIASFGGWPAVNKKFFAEGGLWDSLFK
jgi:sulfate transport system substrate-binding protein